VPFSVAVVSGAAPGFGHVAAQAQLNGAGRDEAVRRLQAGEDPAAIITAITAASFDGIANRRQYGIVDLQGRVAAYTGSMNQAFAGDVHGMMNGYVYTAQGNILTSRAVIDQAAAAFTGMGCDLADKLMLALEAGAANGEGDSRCRPSRPSSKAYLTVDVMGTPAGQYLELDVDGGNGDPVPLVRTQFDAWRATHPCPSAAADMSAAPGSDMSSGGGTTPPAGGCSCDLASTTPAFPFALPLALALALRLTRPR
jgi:uncharacterized Ntn-hydrolase superfamily protein